METATEYLENKENIFPSIKYTFKGKDIAEMMEEYAQYKVNELNKSDVIKSVCECEKDYLTTTGMDKKKYCTRCGNERI